MSNAEILNENDENGEEKPHSRGQRVRTGGGRAKQTCKVCQGKANRKLNERTFEPPLLYWASARSCHHKATCII